MDLKKFEHFLSVASKVVLLLRPRFHNTITNILVMVGIGLLAEAQLNIFEAIGVALYEKYFGPSEFLRKLFASDISPWFGILLITISLIYNGAVTVGLDLIEKLKASIPKSPVFDLSLSNLDGHLLGQVVKLRGKICEITAGRIADNDRLTARSEAAKQAKCAVSGVLISTSFHDPFGVSPNKSFFRERAKFLRVWGGAEVLALRLQNCGDLLARNVRVEIRCSKIDGIDLDNRNEERPNFPCREKTSSLIAPFINRPVVQYDINSSHDENVYFFEWELGNLQAKEIKSSNTEIFVRAEKAFELSMDVYCDELPEPLKFTYQIEPALVKSTVTADQIYGDDDDFSTLANEAIMDGYPDRRMQQNIENYRRVSLVP